MLRSSLLVSMLAVAAASGAIFTPSPAAADPPRPEVISPASLKPAPKRSSKALVAGLTTFLSGYVPFAALGVEGLASGDRDRQYRGWGLVPLAGPWLVIAEPKPQSGDPAEGSANLLLGVFAGLMGISQAVGAVALTAYAVPPEADVEPEKAASTFRIQPVIGFGTAGLVGTF